MEYVYAALILSETGEEVDEPNISAVLEAAGADVETSRVKAHVAALEDVDLDATGPAGDRVTSTGDHTGSGTVDRSGDHPGEDETGEGVETAPRSDETDGDEVVDGAAGEGA